MRYRFVDCRWELGDLARGRELYRSFHIPGASFLDVDEDLSEVSVTGEGRHPLPSAERFAAAASRAGIGNDTWVVAYGSGGGAERLWWLLRHFGHDACAVLLGGIDAWGGPYASGDQAVEPAEFVPRERADDTIGADELAARLGDPALVLVDARPAGVDPARFPRSRPDAPPRRRRPPARPRPAPRDHRPPERRARRDGAASVAGYEPRSSGSPRADQSLQEPG